MRQNLIFSLFILAFSCLTTNLNAQKTILVDTLTYTTPNALPFDEPFFLGIPVQSNNVTSAGYIRVKKNGKYYDNDNIKPIDVAPNVKKLGSQYYNLLLVQDPKLLDPGKHYAFFWTDDATGEIIDAFDYYNAFKQNNDFESFKRAKDIILKIANANKKKTGIIVNFDPSDTALQRLNQYYLDRKSNLSQKYKRYNQIKSDYSSKFQVRIANQLHNSSLLILLLENILNESKNFDSKLKSKLFKNVGQTVFMLSELINITETQYTLIKMGLKTMDCDTCSAEKPIDYIKRLKNLTNTIGEVDELQSVVNVFKNNSDFQGTESRLQELEDDLKQSLKELDSIANARKEILSAVGEFGINNFSDVEGSTVTETFDARTKFSIAPDFGFVTTRLFHDGFNPYGFMPYLGFHINFRPLNRDVPFKSYHHKFLGYFSGFVGWTLVNISNGPNLSQNADSINGFFSGEKGTLMTGLGYRLGNAVRITTGALYYFNFSQKNGASHYERNLKLCPFLGISVDLALKDLFNGITDVFTGTPKSYKPPPPSQ